MSETIATAFKSNELDSAMISEHESKALGHARILEFHKFFSEYQLWLQAGAERFKLKNSCL